MGHPFQISFGFPEMGIRGMSTLVDFTVVRWRGKVDMLQKLRGPCGPRFLLGRWGASIVRTP
jgi:hypothetical protein